MNHLKDEQSAYLQQHKDNPVEWWPYGPKPIQKAKEENKPIFLSIGYSSCHWCHVMADESFEDQETADFLNEHFISIKVDREEHPDLDQYYQSACQLFTESGGWPLSAFLLPDMRPFFAGTYFPKSPRPGLSSFMEILKELNRAYSEERDKVEENAARVTEAIQQGMHNDKEVEFQGHFPAPSAILQAIDEFADKTHGGYGEAPKFPHFAFYEWAVEQMLEGMVQEEYGEHIVFTLERMLMGGVVDQARGGIHRYSTDAHWLTPHFEKMLYDQAGFLRLLSKLSLLYPSPLIFDHLANTLTYLQKEMLAENNYLFSAQDADSEGVEGLYFTFTEEEFDDLINRANDQEGDLKGKLEGRHEEIKSWFQVQPSGNFHNKLNIVALNPEKKKDIFSDEGWKIVRLLKAEILKERQQRIPPFTDTKGICSWNFLMIGSLVDIMQYCRIDGIRQQASQLFNQLMEGSFANFLIQRHDPQAENGGESSLRHTTTKDVTLPYLEDYVFFAEAQLRVYEVTGDQTFKENFSDTLDFIVREFVRDAEVLTRAISAEDREYYPNQQANNFDTSFRSPVATLIHLIRRGRVLLADVNVGQKLENFMETFTHRTLKNPVMAGEALRALSYPEEAYRVVKVPQTWLSEEKFLNFIPYFLSRFVLDYRGEDEGERWEICSLTSCELAGDGLEDFIERLAPKQQQEASSQNE